MSLKTIKERADAATPGPWGWTGNLKLRWVELSTLHSGRLGVMRFDRWGMTGAQPVFLDPESRSLGMGAVTTVKASDVPIFEVCRDATSAADPRVYRQDILGLRHPDAAFIAHARQDIPALLRVAEAAARDMENCAGCKADERGYCYRHNETGPTLRDLDALP